MCRGTIPSGAGHERWLSSDTPAKPEEVKGPDPRWDPAPSHSPVCWRGLLLGADSDAQHLGLLLIRADASARPAPSALPLMTRKARTALRVACPRFLTTSSACVHLLPVFKHHRVRQLLR